jgi:Fungal Zn(2)-Cys(6) binuclear cluster domain
VDLTQSHIDAIIRGKRKAREPKACYPCHTRKVKCDRNLPCDGCVKRDHADLCSYERPSKKRQIATSHPLGDHVGSGCAVSEREAPPAVVSGPDATSPSSIHFKLEGAGPRILVQREDWETVCNKLKEMEQTISSLRMGLEQAEEEQVPALAPTGTRSAYGPNQSEQASPEQEGIHTANMFGGGTIHLGSRSVLAYILNKSGSQQAQALVEGGILPKLGLDNETATYPFVDLWSSDTSTFDISAICGALPSDQQCREFVCPSPGDPE